MKLSKSYTPEIRPQLTFSPHCHSFTTTSFTLTFTPFTNFTNSSPYKPSKPLCLCTSDKLSYPELGGNYDAVFDTENDQTDGVVINIAKTGKRCRRINSSVVINAGFQIVWGILTDYDKLADFIPGLAVSRLIDKRDNYARLFQIGQQNLPLGFKFNAKAVLDCYEKDLEILPSGQRRDIDFKMVEGDFEVFEGKWSIEEYDVEESDESQFGDQSGGKEQETILSYVVEVKPKAWLPVGLIEDRLCKEIMTNLSCVRDEAHLRLKLASSFS